MQTSPPFHTAQGHSKGTVGEHSLVPIIEVRGLRKLLFSASCG